MAIIVLVLVSRRASAQRTGSIPDFRIGRTNNTYFSNADLKKNMAVMLVYFQPDCNECLDFTKDLIKHAGQFKHVQIVMVTNTALQPVRNFESQLKIRNYRNFIIGTEGYTLVLQRALQVTRFPAVAAYNKDGKPLTISNWSRDPAVLVGQLRRVFDPDRLDIRHK